MKSWKYIKNENNDKQISLNESLRLYLNDLNNLELTNNNTISVSYVLKELIDTLWTKSTKPIIEYRNDNEHSIYINKIKLKIENYSFNHQLNEEWITSQKNVFLNLDSNPLPELYPEIWKSKESIRNYYNKKFTSGRIINDNDILYVGILTNHTTNMGSLICFHVDELKSKNAIYDYDFKNNENKSLHPYLILLKNNIN